MIFSQTQFPGLYLIEPKVHGDARGYFFESFLQAEFDKEVGQVKFVQENESKSGYGVLRGLHFQKPPFAQAKLVRCISGSIVDIVVDLRTDSPTYKKWFSVNLSGDNKLQLFIPRGFAHAFCTLEADTDVAYKVDSYYAPDCESGIIWNDPDIAIDWPVAADDVLLSEKDAVLPRLVDVQSPFSYRDRE